MKSYLSSCRSGLSRLDVAIVAALAVLGLGLLLTFLGRVRDPAARVECAEHIRLMGVAILAHNEQTKQLPPSAIDKPYATWAVVVASKVPKGAKSALSQWDLERSYFAQSDDARQAQVETFYCPARKRVSGLSVAGDDAEGKFFAGALGDYAAVAGNGDAAFPWDGPHANGAIILGETLEKQGDRILKWKARTSLESLPRGQSSTMLLGEKHVPLGSFGRAAVGDGSLYNGGNPTSYARIAGPGFGLASGPEAPFNSNFGSYHPNICQFLMADGGLMVRTNDTPEALLGTLASRFPPSPEKQP